MYAKIQAMRKLFAIMILGALLIPQAEAFVYRQQPSYSFRRSTMNNPSRFVRSQWRNTSSRYNYRYISTFQKTDYQRWRELPKHTPSIVNSVQEKGYGQFCNFKDTILGEYLPTVTVTNRCCSCYDGWKCQIPVTAGATIAHPCDPEWAADQGFVNEE